MNHEKVLVIDSEELFGDSTALLDQMELEYDFEFTKENLTKEQVKEEIDLSKTSGKIVAEEGQERWIL